MAQRWTEEEEKKHYEQLHNLYIERNKTIGEIGTLLHISEQTVFKRLKRLQIPPIPHLKDNYLRKKKNVTIPSRSEELAEFFGVMLGDGHLSPTQVVISLGTKESSYAEYVADLLKGLFSATAKIGVRKTGYRDVYLGSTSITRWLQSEGLVSHKVRSQVDVPEWIFSEKKYMEGFLRGFFDTDGSVYRLRFGIQISLTNKSKPLLISLQSMLKTLGYRPSKVGDLRVYLTRVPDVKRFFAEVRPANVKHVRRFDEFISGVGTEVVKRDAL